MIWHIVRFDCSGIDEERRREIEASLDELGAIDVVEWIRVSRDVEEPSVTGLITAFADEQALAAYRVHPEHVPVVERIRDLGLPTTRLDLASDDDPALLA